MIDVALRDKDGAVVAWVKLSDPPSPIVTLPEKCAKSIVFDPKKVSYPFERTIRLRNFRIVHSVHGWGDEYVGHKQ